MSIRVIKETKNDKWMCGKRNFSSLLGKMQSCTDTMGNGMIPEKNKNETTIWYRCVTSRFRPEGSSQYNIQKHDYFYPTHNSQHTHQPRCLLKNKRLKLMQYKHRTEFYLAVRKNGIITFAIKWIKLEIIMLSEVGQTDKYFMFFLPMQTLD